MATKHNEVTEIQFYTVEDVMHITGYKKSKAYEIIAEINRQRKAMGKMVFKGKVIVGAFNTAY